MNTPFKIYLFLLILTVITSCADLVEEGIEIDYPLSNATLTVEPIAGENGAAAEMISYRITANSSSNIKSCIVQAAKEGKTGQDLMSIQLNLTTLLQIIFLALYKKTLNLFLLDTIISFQKKSVKRD